MTTTILQAAANENDRTPRPLPQPASAPDAPPLHKVTVVDNRLRTALRELLRTRTAASESTARQQRRSEDTLNCLLFPHALNTANIAAQGAVPDLARRISALITITIRHTTARTPDDLVRQLLIDIHRRFAPEPTRAIPLSATPPPRPNPPRTRKQ